MQRGPTIVWGEHVQAERAGDMGHDGTAGPNCCGDVSNHSVGRGDQHQVDISGGVVDRHPSPAHVDHIPVDEVVDRLRKRTTGPAGTDHSNRDGRSAHCSSSRPTLRTPSAVAAAATS